MDLLLNSTKTITAIYIDNTRLGILVYSIKTLVILCTANYIYLTDRWDGVTQG